MKERREAALVALLAVAATGTLAYVTRRLWMPQVKKAAVKCHVVRKQDEEVYEAPALNPRTDIAAEANVDQETLTQLEEKVREFFKAVVQKTKGECLMDPVIVCASRYDEPHVEVPQTEEVEAHIETVIEEGERVFGHTAQYQGTKVVF